MLKTNRKSYQKGLYTRKIIDDYCVVDIETTGLSWFRDRIIEIGILRIRDSQIVDQYSQLVNPNQKLSHFITNLTGITNHMLENQPCLEDIQEDVLTFIGDDTILGHNTSFDLNFIINQFHIDLLNEYMDTLQLSRKIYPQLQHYRLTDMVEYLQLSNNEHRSIADCIATFELYEHLKHEMKKRHINF